MEILYSIMATFIDLTDLKFGDWNVLNRGPNTRTSQTQWLCRCKCNITKLVRAVTLRNGTSRSCYICSQKKQRNSGSCHWKGCGEIPGKYWYRVCHGAAERGLEITITIKEAWEQFRIQSGRCVLSGLQVEFGNYYGCGNTASLDRIDSNQGYILGNIQWVHKEINRMKGTLTDDEFIKFCQFVACQANPV